MRTHMSSALMAAIAMGVDVPTYLERAAQLAPERGWKHDPLRLAAAEARRSRRQARNLRNLVRT